MNCAEIKLYADRYRAGIVARLWDQWTAIGGGGYASDLKPVTWAVDPEALILASSACFTHEPRLRETCLAWILTNGGLISIARLKRMQHEYGFGDADAMAGLAETLLATNPSMRSWKSVTGWRKTALVKEARPFQRSELSAGFDPVADACLFLKLRSLLGVSSRVEILFWLYFNEIAPISWMAREIGWYGKTVQKTVGEMVLSGHVREDRYGPSRRYLLVRSEWSSFLPQRDLSEIWLGQHHLYAGVFGILKTMQRCVEEGLADEVANFLMVEELGKGYLAHQRARAYPLRESHVTVSLSSILEKLVTNIESDEHWPAGAFEVDPHRCRIT